MMTPSRTSHIRMQDWADQGCPLASTASQGESHFADVRIKSETRIRDRHRKRARNGLRSLHVYVFLVFIALIPTGCTVTKPSLGAISVTDPGGTASAQITSVIVNASVDVSVAVNNDTTGLGVDWSLQCGGSAVPGYKTNVCGTITPVHVGSNINMVYVAPVYVPIGNTVTLIATATSDPSKSVSVTLTILPQPAAIAFAQGFLPPSTMAVSGTATMAANVLNDPTFSGVNWTVTCGGDSCGSFNPTLTPSGGPAGDTVYTAPHVVPSGGTVTITATSVYDNTKSVSTNVQIMPISVATTISPNPVLEGGTATLTATVSWDVLGNGVAWGVPSCGASDCGTVTPGTCSVGGASSSTSYSCTATYTTPSSFPTGATTLQVSVAATSNSDSTKTGTVSFTVEPPPPISVTLAANPPAVQVYGTTTLSATVSYDFSYSGVTWQCDPACSLTSTTSPSSTTGAAAIYSATYTPAEPIPAGTASIPVLITATSIAAPPSDPTGSGSTTLTVYQPISVALTTQPITAGVPATFSATVTNDIASGGVDWTASGCPPGVTPCGTFNSGNQNAPNHTASGANITYTLSTSIPWATSTPSVTITATSTASDTVPPLRSASAQVPVTPTTFVQFVPFAPSNLPVGNPNASPTLINLIATAVNDSTNQGVDWAVTCSDASVVACGQFLKSPEMVATATTPDVPASFWPYSAKMHAASGQIVAYEPPAQLPTGGTVTLTATSTANPAASATQVVTIASSLAGPALSGKVQVGNLPVSGATVQLFAAGNTGYGSTATPLVIGNGGSSVTTASDGSFSIPAGFACPSLNTLLYLVALGGRPGGPEAPANLQLGLLTAVGPCSNLSGSVPLIVNEVTTVASIYALSPFTGSDYAHIGSSSSNYNNGPNLSNASNNNNGLANAFATVNNLVDMTTGQALLVTPAGNGTAPQDEINTLADAIDTCAASAGGVPGDGSACDAFFEASNVNPVNGAVSTSANAPTSILQAVMEVAQVPSTSRLTHSTSGLPLYNLVANPSFNPPFTPILQTAPYDWSVAISYTGGGLEGQGAASPRPSGLAFDASGNLWISDKKTSSVTELSNLGAALSPFATGTSTSTAGGFEGGGLNRPQAISIDPYGDAWVLNKNNSLTELEFNGTPLTSGNGISGGGNASDTGAGIAIDGDGDVWVADSGTPGDVAEYAGYNGGTVNGAPVPVGTPLSPSGIGYVNGINDPNGAIAVNGSGNVWLLNEGSFTAVELSGPNGQLLDTDAGDQLNPVSNEPDNPPLDILSATNFGVSMAIDHAGDIFIPSTTQINVIYELLAGASTSNFGGVGQATGLSDFDTDNLQPPSPPLAIDGSGHIWAVVGPAGPDPSALAEWTSSGGSLNANGQAQGFVAPSVDGTGLAGVALDASGNVWVLGGLSPSTATEFVGVGAPVVTPLSVAVQKNKLGSEP